MRFFQPWVVAAEADAAAGADDVEPPLLAADEQPRSAAPNPSTVSEERMCFVMMRDLVEMVRTSMPRALVRGCARARSGAAMVRCAALSRTPRAPCDGRPEASQVGHRKRQSALLLGASIGRHQHFHHADAIVE